MISGVELRSSQSGGTSLVTELTLLPFSMPYFKFQKTSTSQGMQTFLVVQFYTTAFVLEKGEPEV